MNIRLFCGPNQVDGQNYNSDDQQKVDQSALRSAFLSDDCRNELLLLNLSRALSFLTLGTYFFISYRKLIQVQIGKILDVDHLVLGLVDGVDKLIQFQVDRPSIPTLSVLDQEDHQERDDRSTRIDHELPSVGVMIKRSCDHPN